LLPKLKFGKIILIMFNLKNLFRKSNLNFQKEFNNSFKRSFTIIELLVVVAVIGLLASVVLVSLKGVKGEARDARRKTDLKAIQTALEMYYNDNNKYPTPGNGWDVGYHYDAPGRTEWLELEALLAPYLTQLPVDPRWPKNNPATDPYKWQGYMYYDRDVPAGQTSADRGKGYTLIAYITETNQEPGCIFGWYQEHHPNRYLCISGH
jgi:type II secretion system protein G